MFENTELEQDDLVRWVARNFKNVKLRPPAPPVARQPKVRALVEDFDISAGESEDISIGTAWYITYEDRDGYVSERRITASKIIRKFDDRYLTAYCYEAEGPRMFKLSRISEAINLGTGEVHDTPEKVSAALLDLANFLHSDAGKNAKDACKDCKHILNILAFLARCDGEYHPEEELQMLVYVAEEWPDYALDESTIKKYLRGLHPTRETFVEGIRSTYRFKSEAFRRRVWRFARSIIEADGMLTFEEQQLYEEIKISPDKKIKKEEEFSDFEALFKD